MSTSPAPDVATALRSALGLDALAAEVRALRAELGNRADSWPAWLTLRRACELSGLTYNTIKSKHGLQPNRGTPDALIAGRRYWRADTVRAWIAALGDSPRGGAA